MPKKKYNDDDGRTIANMDNISPPNLFSFRLPPNHDNNQYSNAQEKKKAKKKTVALGQKKNENGMFWGRSKLPF